MSKLDVEVEKSVEGDLYYLWTQAVNKARKVHVVNVESVKCTVHCLLKPLFTALARRRQVQNAIGS